MNARIDPRDLDPQESRPKGNALTVPIRVIPKSQRTGVATQMVDAILKSFDEYESIIILRQLKELSEEAGKQLSAKIVDIFPFGEKHVVRNNVTIELRGGKKDWEYDDEELTQLEADLEAAKKAVDDRRKMLQSMKADMTVVDEKTGEIKTIHRAKQQNAPTIVAVTFPE